MLVKKSVAMFTFLFCRKKSPPATSFVAFLNGIIAAYVGKCGKKCSEEGGKIFNSDNVALFTMIYCNRFFFSGEIMNADSTQCQGHIVWKKTENLFLF